MALQDGGAPRASWSRTYTRPPASSSCQRPRPLARDRRRSRSPSIVLRTYITNNKPNPNEFNQRAACMGSPAAPVVQAQCFRQTDEAVAHGHTSYHRRNWIYSILKSVCIVSFLKAWLHERRVFFKFKPLEHLSIFQMVTSRRLLALARSAEAT